MLLFAFITHLANPVAADAIVIVLMFRAAALNKVSSFKGPSSGTTKAVDGGGKRSLRAHHVHFFFISCPF